MPLHFLNRKSLFRLSIPIYRTPSAIGIIEGVFLLFCLLQLSCGIDDSVERASASIQRAEKSLQQTGQEAREAMVKATESAEASAESTEQAALALSRIAESAKRLSASAEATAKAMLMIARSMEKSADEGRSASSISASEANSLKEEQRSFQPLTQIVEMFDRLYDVLRSYSEDVSIPNEDETPLEEPEE